MNMQLDRKAIGKYIEVSTAHITKEDNELLGSMKPESLCVYEFTYGYMVCVEDDPDSFEFMLKEGFSEIFVAIMKSASDLGMNWILFDCDGLTHDNFEQFNW